MMIPLTCPTCRYDLSAMPDGKCPECGESFSHDSLAQRRHDRAARRVAAQLVIGVVLVVVICVLAVRAGDAAALHRETVPPAVGVIAVLSTFALIGLSGSALRVSSWVALGAALLMGASFAGALWRTPVGPSTAFGTIVLVGVVARITINWRLGPAVGMAGGALLLLVMGMEYRSDALTKSGAGFRWTRFSWFRDGVNENRFPIAVEDARLVGTAFIVAGGASLLTAGAWAASRLRSRRASR
jgi:hypothetical protein